MKLSFRHEIHAGLHRHALWLADGGCGLQLCMFSPAYLQGPALARAQRCAVVVYITGSSHGAACSAYQIRILGKLSQTPLGTSCRLKTTIACAQSTQSLLRSLTHS